MTDFDSYVRRHFGLSLRPVQREILPRVEQALLSNRVVLLEAPTGTGKSLIPLTFAHMNPDYYVYIVTPTTYLQRQYASDLSRWFSDSEWTVMMGRRNYPCPYLRELYPDTRAYTAADCVVVNEAGGRCPYVYKTSEKALFDSDLRRTIIEASARFAVLPRFVAYYKDAENTCPYYLARMVAASRRIVVTNYDYFFLDFFVSQSLHFPHLVVFDEGHALIDRILSRFTVEVSLNDRAFSEFGIEVGDIRISVSRGFIAPVATLIDRIEYVLSDDEVFKDVIKSLQKYALYKRLLRYYTELLMLVRVPEAYKGRVRMKGDRILAYVNPYVFLASFIRRYLSARPLVFSDRTGEFPYYSFPSERRVLLMSATLGPRDMWDSVLRGIRYDYIGGIPSPFPPERRTVYYPVYPYNERIRLSGYNRFPDYATLSRVVDEIVRGFSLVRRYFQHRPALVVHAYLKSLALDVFDTLVDRFDDLGIDVPVFPAVSDALDPYDDKTLRDVIASFVEEGGVLVSTTAAAEGVDFKGDIARLQYILKLPYPNEFSADPYVDFRVAKMVVQMAGRVVRSRDDYGFTIVLDQAARSHLYTASHFYPKYFLKAVVDDLYLDEIYRDIEEKFRRFGGEKVGS